MKLTLSPFPLIVVPVTWFHKICGKTHGLKNGHEQSKSASTCKSHIHRTSDCFKIMKRIPLFTLLQYQVVCFLSRGKRRILRQYRKYRYRELLSVKSALKLVCTLMSEWVSRVQRPTRHNTGHFGGGYAGVLQNWQLFSRRYLSLERR